MASHTYFETLSVAAGGQIVQTSHTHIASNKIFANSKCGRRSTVPDVEILTQANDYLLTTTTM